MVQYIEESRTWKLLLITCFVTSSKTIRSPSITTLKLFSRSASIRGGGPSLPLLLRLKLPVVLVLRSLPVFQKYDVEGNTCTYVKPPYAARFRGLQVYSSKRVRGKLVGLATLGNTLGCPESD